MPFTMPDTLEGLDRNELTTLTEQATAEFRELYSAETADGAVASPEGLERLEELGAHIDALEQRLAEVAADEQGRAEAAQALADRVLAEPEGEDAPAEQAEGEDAPAEQAEDEGAEPVAEQEQERELVTASARRERTSFRALGTSDADRVPERAHRGYRMAPSVPGALSGYVTSAELGEAYDRMASGGLVRSLRQETYGSGKHAATLGTLARDFPAEFTAQDTDSLVAAVDHATSEKRLPGGSLVAAAGDAGGWCSPSETVYDFLGIPTTGDLLDLPDIQVNRGGIRFPVQPDFGLAFTTPGFLYTEAEAVANYEDAEFEKPCFEVPCVGFDEVRLDAVGLCVTAGILQQKGFPEVVATYIDGIMKAHVHRLNSYTIGKVVEGSTEVDLTSGWGAWANLVNAVELAITDTRTRNRIPTSQSLEVILPTWAEPVMRADLSARYKIDLDQMTDARIRAHFAARGAAVQFVTDWQIGEAGQPGAETPITEWPGEIQFVVYPAGTWFRSQQDVIEVGNLYDQAQLRRNRFTALFTEDAVAVGKRGLDSRLYTVPLRVGALAGDTGGGGVEG